MGMTNYRNGPTTDHNGAVINYNGLVLDRVANFGTSYGMSSSHHIETTDAGLDGLCIREMSVYHRNL